MAHSFIRGWNHMQKTVKEIAMLVKGELVGPGEAVISSINGIKEAKEGDLSFIIDQKYEGLIDPSGASCVITPKTVRLVHNKPVIKVDDPSITFSKIIEYAIPEMVPHPKGIHQAAIVSKKASIGKNVSIGPYVVIEDNASIGDNTVIYPFSYIGAASMVGANCVIYPNVTIRERIIIGDRVIIHSGSVIGSDGFGYDTRKDGTHVKIPQIGIVVVEDDVEIGACTTIDRARFSKTVIGKGSKIDNLVQVAHNVILGPNCILAGQVGISGSSELGRNVVLGGGVGVADHVKLGDFVMAGGRTGISRSYPANTKLFWYPAKPVKKARDILASIGLLPKLFDRVRALEAEVKELKKK